jgi:hypothetical protein
MVEKREHYIAAGYARKTTTDLRFPDLMRTSKNEFLRRAVINTEPPPERQVLLVVGISEYEQILSSSLQRVFGFIFEKEVVLDGLNLRPLVLQSLRALLERMLRENQTIKHFGAAVALSCIGSTIDEMKYVYGEMTNPCDEASTEVRINFELILKENLLPGFLESQFNKIVHGDIKAQLAAFKP